MLWWGHVGWQAAMPQPVAQVRETCVDPLLILAAGLVTVIGAILLVRLPAFLALLLGAGVVGYMSGPENFRLYAENKVEIDHRKELTQLPPEERAAAPPLTDEERQQREQAIISSLTGKATATRIAEGLGNTAAGLAILIAMAAIVGVCLIESGAAERIVRSAMRLFGEARAAFALSGSAYLLGIPVFFDTLFYLMLPLARALRARSGKNYLLYVLAIATGGAITHSLVPPTPGPLATAQILNVDLLPMILGGLVVGFFAAVAGLGWAVWCNACYDLPLRDTGDVSAEDFEEMVRRDDSQLPPLWLSLSPILLPVLLIAGNEIYDVFVQKVAGGQPDAIQRMLSTLGDRNIAMSLAALVALLMLIWQKRPNKEELRKSLDGALTSAATIILITSAGGAFGAVLQHTGIGQRLGELVQEYNLPLVPLAFVVTMVIRAAQGSATVSMLTGASICATIPSDGLSPLWVALAVGAGSKPLSWMNDSGFWIVGKMSGMTEGETLRFWTSLMTVMGVVAGLVVWIGSLLFPTLGAS